MASESKPDRVNVTTFGSSGGFGAVFRPLEYPLGKDVADKTLEWINLLLNHVQIKGPFAETMLLQYNQLHNSDAGHILAARGRDWMPTLGLGVWPYEPPPRLWKREDFTELGIGEMPPPMMHQLFQLKSGSTPTRESCQLLWASGSALICLTDRELNSLYPALKAYFLQSIEEPALRCFHYYFPMLRAATFAAMESCGVPPWFDGIRLYIRQSPEDGGLLLWSQLDLGDFFQKIGLRRSAEDNNVWVES